MTTHTLATDLRDVRLARGLTQRDVAAIFGVHPNTVARWDRGEQAVHPARVEAVERWVRGDVGRQAWEPTAPRKE
jgi:transcriptional regulator with XRE-family HTH domain